MEISWSFGIRAPGTRIAETCWEFMPGKWQVPPWSFPPTTIGGQSLSGRVIKQFAPNSEKAFIAGRTGRLHICSSPVITAKPSIKVQRPVTKLVVVPEFPVSITDEGAFKIPFNPEICHVLSVFCIFAPRDTAALKALRPSLLGKGLFMIEVPSARRAMKTALIVWLFEPGTRMLPFNELFFEITYMKTG